MANGNVENVKYLRLDEIEVNPKWNTRSNLEESQHGPEEAGSFDDFKKNIFVRGQDTSIVVRPNKEGSKKPFFLVTGNRRYEAHMRIAAEGKDPAWATPGWCKVPTIRAEIRKLSDVDAFELNLSENTEREDLPPADIAFGVGRLCNAYRDAGTKYTQELIAERIGFSTSHCGKLMHIVGEGRYENGKGLKKDIFDNWRSSPLRQSVDDIHRIANMPLADQDKAYADLCRRGEEKEKEGSGQGDPLKAAAKKAEGVGTLLGILVREGAISVDLNDDEWWRDWLPVIVPIKTRKGRAKEAKPPTEGQITKVVKAAMKSYNDALIAEEEEEEEGEGKGKGKKKRNGEAHAN